AGFMASTYSRNTPKNAACEALGPSPTVDSLSTLRDPLFLLLLEAVLLLFLVPRSRLPRPPLRARRLEVALRDGGELVLHCELERVTVPELHVHGDGVRVDGRRALDREPVRQRPSRRPL